MIERSDGSFELSTNAHNHPADPGAAVSAAIRATVKAKAAADFFRPASAIVEEVLLEQMTDGPCSSLPRPEYIARAANRKRQQLRPKDPLDLDFELEDDHIPEDFFRSDIKVRACRHLMFATDQQLPFLARAKGWHIDGTFKLCKRGSHQTSSAVIRPYVGKEEKRLLQSVQAASGDPAISPSRRADHPRL